MRAAVEAGQVVFTSDATDDGGAYVDSDLLPAIGEIEVDVVKADSPAVAAGVYAGRAEALADILRSADGPVEVVGSGITALLVRSLVPSVPGDDRPGTIVDLTGDPENVAAATRRLRDLGTLFLAAPSGGRLLDVDLYPDVHVRGLRVVGALDLPVGATDVPIEVGEPRVAPLGRPTALGPSWYYVSARPT